MTKKGKIAGSHWCSAVNCSNNKLQHKSLSFFRFPLDAKKGKIAGSHWCSALNCSNNKLQHKSLSFFRFPLDAER